LGAHLLSNADSEYVSLSKTSMEATFLSRMMKEITGMEIAVTVYNDSESAEALARDAVLRDRAEHFDVKRHVDRKQVQAAVTVRQYLNTKESLADVLTKPLPKEKSWTSGWELHAQ
jgi:hypothetical protein